MTDPLVRELLEWIAVRPRTYDETMEAWRSHCPRQTVWEDACMAGFIEVVGDGVAVTERGRAELLDGAGAAFFRRK
ncbi:MAG TPA: hypothetical protein VKE70_04340 [Candidatus Solibacter sp.]|nr:hypothetical protein [Candidatus Solibacter sp.]